MILYRVSGYLIIPNIIVQFPDHVSIICSLIAMKSLATHDVDT